MIENTILTFLMISCRDELRKELASVLPKEWMLYTFKDILEAQNMFTKIPAGDFITLFDFADLSKRIDHTSHDDFWMRRIVAIIDDISQREKALQAGADDYLLRPLIRSEIQARLGTARQGGAFVRWLLLQLKQRNRQAYVGRLTSHICHEINNAM